MNKNKIVTILVVIVTIVLSAIAVFTAIRLYQTRDVSVTPDSSSADAGACRMSFTLSSAVPTATATPPNAPVCNMLCTLNSGDCQPLYVCRTTSDGTNRCRNPQCGSKVDCVCDIATATPTVTATPTTPPDGPTATPTVTATPTTPPDGPTATPTTTGQGTVTPTATATSNPACNNSCTQNTDCPDGLMCYIPSGNSGNCRNTSCLTDTDCICSIAQEPTSQSTSQPTLPDAGISWPTWLGTAFGILVIIGSLLLAF